MNGPILLAAAALALAACTPDFDPASKVEKLRVLAVQAEPPEIEPAGPTAVAPDRAALTSLVVRADEAADPTRKTTVLYLACIPVPGDPEPNPCVALAELRDPTVVVADAARASCAGGGGEEPPIAFAGVEVCESRRPCTAATSGATTFPLPEVVVPVGYGFPPDTPEEIIGVQVVVLAFALDATPDELAAGAGATCPLGDVAARLAELWAAREHVLATKRVWIRGLLAPDLPNVNPAIEDIAEGAGALPATVAPGTHLLAPILPAGADHQLYTELDANGAPIERDKREEWVYSWFSTVGELDVLHTRDGETEEWVVPAGAGPAFIVTVVRDLRGGVAWTTRDVTIAP
jgi:hypothetical protein